MILGLNEIYFGQDKKPFAISEKQRVLMSKNEYIDTFTKLYELIMKNIKIEGLDDERFVGIREQTFLNIWLCKGEWCFEEVQPKRFMCYPCNRGPFFNANLMPTSVFRYYLNGGDTKELKCFIPGADSVKEATRTVKGFEKVDDFQCVYGQCNSLIRPLFYELWATAMRLTDIQTTLDVIAISTKKPILLSVSEENEKTVRDALEDIRANKVPMATYKGVMNGSEISAVDLGYKVGTLKELLEYYDAIEGRFMLSHGIDSNPQEDKKERVLTAEVTTSGIQINLNFERMVYGLNEFFDNVRAAYGEDIKLKAVKRIDENEEEEDEQTDDLSGMENEPSDILER